LIFQDLDKGVYKMTQAEIRQAKGNLHCLLVDEIFSYGGTWQNEAELWLYVIELASNELQKNYAEVRKSLLTK
jgi:hypothetical protein